MISNRAALLDHGNTERRRDLIAIAEQSLEAVQPDRLVPEVVSVTDNHLTVGEESYDLDTIENLYVFGAGKGSLATVSAVLDVLGDRYTRALAVEKRGQGEPVDGIEVHEAGHPVPDEHGRRAGDAVIELAESAGEQDLVIACITGGASALLPAPATGIPFDDLVETTELLLEAGLPIDRINAVRKHVSSIKGGQLAGMIHPAKTISLIVVDEVAGDPWGPTVPDETTFEDAIEVLTVTDLWESVPDAVRDRLERGRADPTMETPGPGDVSEYRTQAVILADATDVCTAASDAASELGYTAPILSTSMEGESADIARAHAAIATEIEDYARPFEPPVVLVSGGETTVEIGKSPGVGGPNQEFAVQFATDIAACSDISCLAIGTDGTDGPTEIAGGLVDGTTADRAESAGVDLREAVRRHDSSTGLERVNDAVRTGGTGTNLMDLRLVAVGESDV
ncbi:MAG: glycerate kinase [Halodesulfurarchaeum sp.]